MDRRLLVLGYCLFLGPFGGVNVIIPMQGVLQKDLHTTLEMITLSISVAMVPFALLQFFSGALADRWGERRLMVAGIGVYGLGSLACGIAPEIWTFMTGRAVQGIGLALFNPVALAMVGDIVPCERRGYVMGWMGTINTAGIAGGPLAGGLAAMVDWRLAYYLIIAMTGVSVVMFWRWIPERPPVTSGRATMLGELGSAAKDRALQYVCIGGFCAFFAYGAALTFVGKALEGAPYSYSEGTIGTAIAAGGLAGILVSPGAGRISDRLGRGKASLIGFSLALLSYLAFIVAGSLIAVMAVFFVLGAAMAFTWAGLITLSVEVIPGARNVSSTLFNAMRFSGYALSPFLLVFVYTSRGLPSVLAISAAVALLGMATAVALARRAGGDVPGKCQVNAEKAGP